MPRTVADIDADLAVLYEARREAYRGQSGTFSGPNSQTSVVYRSLQELNGQIDRLEGERKQLLSSTTRSTFGTRANFNTTA